MIKICFIISSLRGGGAERVVTELSNYFERNKIFEVSIIIVENTRNAYNLNCDVEIVNLNLENKRHTVFNTYDRIKNTYLAIGAINPDIVISFMTATNIETIVASKFRGKRIIISERANPYLSAKNFYQKVMRRFIYPLADILVCQTRESTLYYKWMKRKISIENPVKKIKIDKGKKEKVFLGVGSLRFEKGFDLLISAFKKFDLQAKNDDWKLIIVGEGKLRRELEQKVSSYGLGGKVILAGHTRQIDNYYSKASIFVLSSRSEGMPNVLIEAMSSGIPCISFDCKFGPSEMIDNNVDGLLVPCENIKELAKAMVSLSCNDEKQKKISKNARITSKKYSIEEIGNKWYTLIKRLV